MPTLFEAPQKAKSPNRDPGRSHGRSKMRPLTSFAVNPDGVRFETQEEEERVILFLRQHNIVNVPWVVVAIILVFAPSFLIPLLIQNVPFSIPPSYFLVGTLAWYLATVGFILTNFLRWFFNIYIVTNERIVDIDFYYLLFKRFSQAELEKIQDISYSTGGVFATVFNYGEVMVETAGEAPNLEFVAVPRPDIVVETIRSITEELPGSI
ncbi:MAG: putative membrane protein [Candidatus Curtissbacteria bacterium GW2011_GWA1_41_11]|uniref:Putative membrane protein n=1 Tax=Candidatus Curtissbacteria bacterium GW2011_GWA1_41_11 TaxID=1618409 RepID=A0A0G0XFA9_9BACT|nr:MAG: putative membrane protein [Candidatus Curtissbacteria bacterium GW2011_GWA1_41_11]